MLGVFSAGHGDVAGVLGLLLASYLALIPVAWFVARVAGAWWSIGGTATLALALLQMVVPRLELLLDRGASLVQFPWTVLHAVGTAAAGAAALMLMLRPWQFEDQAPPYSWPAGDGRSYLWRVPLAVGCYAAFQVLAARLGRLIFGHSTNPPLGSELLDKLALGSIAVLAAWCLSGHLGVRSRRRLAVLVSIFAVVPAVGRWQVLAGLPLGFLGTRVGVRLLADLAAGFVFAHTLLATVVRIAPSPPRRDKPETDADEQQSPQVAKMDEKTGSGEEAVEPETASEHSQSGN